jgi:hypothetical protein
MRFFVVAAAATLLDAPTGGWHAAACRAYSRIVERHGRPEYPDEVIVLGNALGLLSDPARMRRTAAAGLLTAIVRRCWDAEALGFVHNALSLRVPLAASEIVIFVQSLFRHATGDDASGTQALMACVAALGAADVPSPASVVRSRSLAALQAQLAGQQVTDMCRYDWRDWTVSSELPTAAVCDQCPFSIALTALCMAWCEAVSPSMRRSIAAASLRDLLRPSGLSIFEAMQLHRQDVYPQIFTVLLDPARGAGAEDGKGVTTFATVCACVRAFVDICVRPARARVLLPHASPGSHTDTRRSSWAGRSRRSSF